MHVVDQELLSRLLDQHGAALVLYAQQWCNCPEDVVQDGIVRLMCQRPAPVNHVGWLYRVVRNLAVSTSRASGRRKRYEARASRQEPWFKTSSDDDLDAAAAVETLESLPVEQREAIVLRLWSGLSFEEIAELIGRSTSTAHRRYEMGLDALRGKWSLSCTNERKKR